jgi:ADP-ribosyl-[dinitrogen reductase] hydrolase
MLLELAIGDAYGAGFEYVRDRRFISLNNNLKCYVKHPTHRLKPGCYTDDTQMSLAIAELVLDALPWTPESVAAQFVECFHRDPREGYSGRFYKFLRKTKTGTEFLTAIDPGSEKSGAAMRAGPIGIYRDTAEVIRRCTLQAQLTHNTRDGVAAAVAVSLGMHYFLYDLGPKDHLPSFLKRYVPFNWADPWSGEVGSKGLMSVRAAITSVLRNDSLSSILRSSIAWGGDTDTVASISMALASVSKEVDHDLPDHLVRNLEDGKYGQKYLRQLDERLTAKHKLELHKKGFSGKWRTSRF